LQSDADSHMIGGSQGFTNEWRDGYSQE
jgi:hypothetical protein